MSTRATDISGTLTPATLMNPSPLRHVDIWGFLTHPRNPSLKNHSEGDLGSKPGRQVHSYSSYTRYGLQLLFDPQCP
ncbi:hypothetical protein CICLE_v10017366mg [Citrus x clementina]|uniref:Uncharacterized protein n=1 Tax=Citrus clementina TaxID=85681 RepID=V4UJB4_CITCL|nr:hypothetical protein CICLE_v10017366mg [Citrus x clementina]